MHCSTFSRSKVAYRLSQFKPYIHTFKLISYIASNTLKAINRHSPLVSFSDLLRLFASVCVHNNHCKHKQKVHVKMGEVWE